MSLRAPSHKLSEAGLLRKMSGTEVDNLKPSACKKISLHGHLRKIIRLDCFHVLLL